MSQTLSDGIDDQLLELVHVVNTYEEASFGLTLIVGGSVVTGTLIGSLEYFKSLGEQLVRNLSDSAKRDAVIETWKKIGTTAQQKILEDAKAVLPDRVSRESRYIHLRDARIIVGNRTIPVNAGLLWRGKLADVQGFSLGIVADPEVIDFSRQPHAYTRG